MEEYRDTIPHRSPCGADPLGLKILEEAKRGKLETVISRLENSFRGESMWDQRAFYVSLAANNLRGKQAALLATRRRPPPDQGCFQSFSKSLWSFFGTPNPPSPAEHALIMLEQDPSFPNTAVGKLIEGEWLIRRAWDARGGGTADTVSDRARHVFKERLVKARNCLLQAAELDTEDPTPYATLQTVAMGLPSVPRVTAKHWMNEALKRDPLNRSARRRHLLLLCKKWGGSHQEMYVFARECIKVSPPGSHLKTLLFQAFYEHHMYLKHFILGREAKVLQEAKKPGKQRLLVVWEKKKAETEKELKDLLENSSKETMQIYQEVLAAAEIHDVSHYASHYDAFLWFYTREDKELARKVYDKMSPYFPM